MKTAFVLCAIWATSIATIACADATSASTSSTTTSGRPTLHAAIEACATKYNLQKPQPGEPPSEADRQTMDACLSSQGLQMPHHPGPPPEVRSPSTSNEN